MAQNDLKWPKNDARIYALFPQFFLTEKAVPQTFLLLECMLPSIYSARECLALQNIQIKNKNVKI